MSDYALVTGGARSIGAAICHRLRSDGFRVVVLDQHAPEHDAYDEALRLDMAELDALSEALGDLGGRLAVTRLINNAGIVRPAGLTETSPADVQDVLRVNVQAPIVATQALLPAMTRAGRGRIVNIASRAALGKQLRSAYASSKAGLIGLTRTWALELARTGITVNAVGPGPIETPLFAATNPPNSPATRKIVADIPVGFMGSPGDVADAVSFFVSDRARFVTGQVLYVCGGMTIGAAAL